MRLMGAALLTVAGLLAGLSTAGELRRTALRRARLCRLLEGMGFELGRFQTPLPELFEILAGQTEGEARRLCLRVRERMPELGRTPFSVIWAETLAALPEGERRLLAPLGAVLGRYGTEELLTALETCRRDMVQAAGEANRRARENSRVYIGLCTAGGMMLGVVLL